VYWNNSGVNTNKLIRETTPTMSSYLVTDVIGPYDYVDRTIIDNFIWKFPINTCAKLNQYEKKINNVWYT
jgi:hypothetical protein